MAEQIAPRDTYGKTIAELGKTNEDIVVLDADLGPSTMVKYFQAAFPDRFIEVGIAEANMIGIAAGLAASGKLPFASTFAAFASSYVSKDKLWKNRRVEIIYEKGGEKQLGYKESVYTPSLIF